MTDFVPYLAVGAACFAVGAAAILWLKSRKTTTKAEALKLLAAEYSLVSRMPGAAEDLAQAQAEVAAEELAAKLFAAAVTKAQSVSTGA
jgi:acetyl-CoA carboxylase alpha subunit